MYPRLTGGPGGAKRENVSRLVEVGLHWIRGSSGTVASPIFLDAGLVLDDGWDGGGSTTFTSLRTDWPC